MKEVKETDTLPLHCRPDFVSFEALRDPETLKRVFGARLDTFVRDVLEGGRYGKNTDRQNREVRRDT